MSPVSSPTVVSGGVLAEIGVFSATKSCIYIWPKHS
jgi:hypothetical protein